MYLDTTLQNTRLNIRRLNCCIMMQFSLLYWDFELYGNFESFDMQFYSMQPEIDLKIVSRHKIDVNFRLWNIFLVSPSLHLSISLTLLSLSLCIHSHTIILNLIQQMEQKKISILKKVCFLMVKVVNCSKCYKRYENLMLISHVK